MIAASLVAEGRRRQRLCPGGGQPLTTNHSPQLSKKLRSFHRPCHPGRRKAAIRDAQALKDERDLLKAEVSNLKDALHAQEIALAKAEAREEIRKEMDARIDVVLAENRKTLEDTRALLALYDKQMERMERRMLITQILGVLGPIGLGVAFFLR